MLTTCFKCLGDFDQDDIVWADMKGQNTNENYAWCVPCLPSQIEVTPC